jgi:hypothetical protein
LAAETGDGEAFESEFVEIGFAENDGAGATKGSNGRCVVRGCGGVES